MSASFITQSRHVRVPLVLGILIFAEMDQRPSRKRAKHDHQTPYSDEEVSHSPPALSANLRTGITSSATLGTSPNYKYADSNIKLTGIQDLPTSENVDTVTITSILGYGDLKEMVQLNYHVDLDWLMSKLPPEKANSLPTTVVHGWRQDEAHIIKAMLLFYNDDTMRVVIHTANLVSSDWRNKTQAVYTSPVLHKKRSPQLSSSPAEMSMFEKDLTDYFKAYGHQLSRFCELFKDYDFSECKVCV
ncbi:hypothetical protein BC938DRAFT_482062 [Jimgerdemannia flammicorona]|uniref:Tyrosyl-DNA phosphodiesterase-domain-containing protein n=1 Tax=Jimgerdemannia flammicorona TaxID=994334 RepID=A0A433QWJ1_9FUNG|nr:hypothetical protein BC938DRAFT_482062 [Jimgerdemannia flammicorona]